MPLHVGQVLENRYRIDALLGQGGMGAVYRAQDLHLDRPVALKENALATPESARQFESEAKMMARLRHPNLPAVSDHFVSPGGAQYLVMEYVEGEDLGQMLTRRGPLPEAEVRSWIEQVCDALTYLHGQRPPVIHRDIKPSNIKITPDGRVYLVDFGIAKLGEAGVKTATGAIGVTPGFSPPEQYGEGSTDARSDIYALGATLYTLLAGQPPPESVLRAIQSASLRPLQALRPDVSPAVAQAVDAALQTSPTRRPASAAAFRALLRTGRTAAPATPVASGAAAARPVPAPVQAKPAPARPARSRRGGADPVLWILVAAAAVVLVAGGIGLALLAGDGPEATPTAVSRLATTEAAPTATQPAPAATLTPEAATPTATAPVPSDTPTPPPSDTPAPPPSDTPAPPPSDTPTPAARDSYTRPADGMVMVYVPAGTFDMGSSSAELEAAFRSCLDCEPDRFADELPLHSVTLDAFWIDRTEVTNAMYQACVRAGACQLPGPNSKCQMPTDGGREMSQDPVVCVNWKEARIYCAWAGGRLPTSAEWEKAARGTDLRSYPWGNTFDPSRLNYCDRSCTLEQRDATADDGYAQTSPVGSFPAGMSPYGALDMSGNAWELVNDWWSTDYYGRSPARNPQGPDSGERKVVRGGSWYNSSWSLRCASTSWAGPGDRREWMGFRCARDGR